MPQNSPSADKIRFGAFEAHLSSGEVYRQGRKVRLQGLPFQVLEALLLSPGQLVSRQELCRRLWPEGTFVDFDNSLNSAVNRLREALGDSAANPRFVETVPGRGYRFIAPVVAEARLSRPLAPGNGSGFGPWVRGLAGAALVLLALSVAFWGLQRAGWIGGQERVRLAVLPFANLSGDSAQDYFGDGLTDEMIARLGGLDVRRLGVIARRSAMLYKGSDKPLGQIASELDADYLLEGTVRQQGERVRITARLVQAEDSTQLWSASFDRNPQEVLEVQQEVAARVARSLALKLLPGSAPPKAPAPSFDSLSYDAYLKGRYHWNKQGPKAVLKAIEHFRQSIGHDPGFAPAHAGLADCYNFLAGAGHQPAAEAYRTARQSAERAVELDDSLAEGHAALGVVLLFADRNLEGAGRELERALELNPSLTTAHLWTGCLHAASGQPERAVEAALQARLVDPQSFVAYSNLGWYHYYARQYDAAIRESRRALDLEESHHLARVCLQLAYRKKGMPAQALQEAKSLLKAFGAPEDDLDAFDSLPAQQGLEEALRQQLKWLEKATQQTYISPYVLAFYASLLGREQQALDWLEEAVDERASHLVYLPIDPSFDELRDRPRFRLLMSRLQKP